MNAQKNLILILTLTVTNNFGQSEIKNSYTKKRIDKHKKADDDYIDQTFQNELEHLKKSSLARQQRASEKNKNLATYLNNNHASMTELQKKFKKCNANLSSNQDKWQALDSFIKEYAEINAQYDKEASEIHQDYTNKIVQAQIKRDNAKDEARRKAVNQEFAEIKDSLISQNNNPECIELLENLLADFKEKRIAGLDIFINDENQSRKKYLDAKRDINKGWSEKTSRDRAKKYQEHKEITISSKKSLLKKVFNKS